MKRLTEKIVFSGFVTACRRAKRPTRRSPLGVTATTDGVSRSPSAFGMTVGSPPSMVAITELVVPRSMPIVRAMFVLSLYPNIPHVRATPASPLLTVMPMSPVTTLWVPGPLCRLAVITRSHLHHRRPQDAVAEPVAGCVDGDNRVAARWLRLDRLMH